MTDLQNRIMKLKKESGTCILAHCYQSPEILEVADFVGDSFALAQKAEQTAAETVIMCGVRFMAQTVKILCPEKRVILPEPTAGCPMAEMMSAQELKSLRKRYPDRAVVAYINTTAELKALCDVCVTSSSAEKIVKNIENDKILFIPDRNLGDFTKKMIPEKDIVTSDGCCPIHAQMTEKDVSLAKREHPDALLLVHPECPPEVVKLADYVGSTTGIMSFAERSEKNEFIIGTEMSIVEHLSRSCPDKKFFPLSEKLVCRDMRITTLESIEKALLGTDGEEIKMKEKLRVLAKKPINEMLRLG